MSRSEFEPLRIWVSPDNMDLQIWWDYYPHSQEKKTVLMIMMIHYYHVNAWFSWTAFIIHALFSTLQCPPSDLPNMSTCVSWVQLSTLLLKCNHNWWSCLHKIIMDEHFSWVLFALIYLPIICTCGLSPNVTFTVSVNHRWQCCQHLRDAIKPKRDHTRCQQKEDDTRGRNKTKARSHIPKQIFFFVIRRNDHATSCLSMMITNAMLF